MSVYPNAAHAGGHSRHSLPVTVSAQPNGECGRIALISRRSSTSLWPVRAVRRRAARRPHDRTRFLALCVLALGFDAEGAGR
jgi:hypothetical protein